MINKEEWENVNHVVSVTTTTTRLYRISGPCDEQTAKAMAFALYESGEPGNVSEHHKVRWEHCSARRIDP